MDPFAAKATRDPHPPPPPWVATATDLARRAHAGQIDKLGQPYILHPTRVVEYLKTSRGYARLDPDSQWVAQAAAWLHDVVEDTPFDRAALRAEGLPDRVADVVELLTRRSKPPDDDYAAIARNPIARAVKLADIEDNTDPQRLGQLVEEERQRLSAKYLRALAALGVPLPTETSTRQVSASAKQAPRDSSFVQATLGPAGLELAGDDVGPAMNMLGGSQVEWWITVRPHDLGRLMELLEATPANLLEKFSMRFEREWCSRHGLIQALDADHVRYAASTWFSGD